MITRLRAENFKSWRDTGDLRLAPLTGLFGTNSSGKSSILQILLMLGQTAESLDRNTVLDLGGDSSLVRLGSFNDMIHQHSNEASLKISLSSDGGGRGISHSVSGKDEELISAYDFAASFRQRQQRIVVDEFRYSVNGRVIGMEATANDRYQLIDDSASVPQRNLPAPDKFYGFPLGVQFGSRNVLYSRIMPDLLENNLKRDIHYLGPLRQHPRRTYLWSGNPPFGVGPDGSLAVQALIAARLSGWSLEKEVADCLQNMGLIHSFRVVPLAEGRQDYEVRVKKAERSAEVLLTDVGFGVSQILPVIVLCYSAIPESTLILEHPEIHLHPAAQSDLADVLVDAVKTRKLQIIVESHSEHLLRRIQRRIAEGKFSKRDAALYFCEMENGESKARKLEISDDGFIKNWPKDFFGDEMGDLVAMTEAAAKRQISSTK